MSTQGGSIHLQEGPGDWLVYLDDTLGGGTAGETNFGNRTIRLNPSYLNNLSRIALHEIGHTLLLNDVSYGSCAGETIMYATLGGIADSPTAADECTLQHVYTFNDESPIILTLEEGFPQLTAPEVLFDLSNCGSPQLIGWTAPHTRQGFLALDRDSDGLIESGAEMFGNFTPLSNGLGLAINGFDALALFDEAAYGGNGDGWISNADSIYASLQLWIDDNHNGVTDLGELRRLRDLGVQAISLSARESRQRDEFGNELRYISKFLLRLPSGSIVPRRAVDVYFVHQ
jgi:hypothetical protein